MSVLNLFHRGRAEWVCEYVSREAKWYFSELSEFQSSQYREVMRPHGKEGQVQLGPTWCWGDCYAHVEGWGLMLLWRDCLCPRDVAAVGSINQLWDGSDETERWKLVVLDTKKSSPMDSVSMHRKRVQWTRFLCLENESSPLDSVSSLKNRFLCIKHCQFPLFCLITPIPQQHQLTTAATSRGHKQSLHSSISPQPSTWA